MMQQFLANYLAIAFKIASSFLSQGKGKLCVPETVVFLCYVGRNQCLLVPAGKVPGFLMEIFKLFE